jgi:hypothetical protein
MIENIQHEYFIWEEKNSTDLNPNLLKNAEQDKCVTTTETNQNVENLHWKDITDVKLRRKMYQKAYLKNYYKTNRNEILNHVSNYYQLNKDKIKEYNKNLGKKKRTQRKIEKQIWLESNKDIIELEDKLQSKIRTKKKKQYKKEWGIKNKDRLNEKNREKRKNDIQFKLKCVLRKRLSDAVRNNRKNGSAIRDLGCTIEQLKQYLESKFQPDMTWDNYGLHGWHIDHIKPLSSFNLTDRNQLLEACHYTNLQPLWAIDNLIKGNKII